MKRALIGCVLFLVACGDESGTNADAGAPDAERAACSAWSHDGLEPACDFEAAASTGRSAPSASALPKPTGVCPGFAAGAGCTEESGSLLCTFQPAGEPERTVQIWMPPTPGNPEGPMVFYYYGLLGWPANAVTPLAGFPPDALQRLRDAGGMLVAPRARADREPPRLSRLPWIDALGLEDDPGDFLLVDEVVACAIEQVGIDVRRIHVSGLSAGGWMTSRVAVNRSNFVASIVTFSGGIENLRGLQDPTNKFAVAMFNGGTTDYVGAHFENEAQSGVNIWRLLGHFAVDCEHGGGHSVPTQAGLAGMQFLLDHPYGTVGSPHCSAAPPEMSFCALTTPAGLGVHPEANRPDGEVAACSEMVAGMGLGSALFTEKMVSCACSRCGTQLEACLNDTGCAENMRCAAEKSCFGISCYQDQLCAPAIDAAGGAVGASAQLAVAFSDCVGAAACDACSLPPR